MMTPKIKKIFPYFIVLVCGTLFYSFELIPDFSDKYYSAEKEFLTLKKRNTLALNQVKNYAKGSAQYLNYSMINTNKKLAYKKFDKIRTEEITFGFDSFKIFAERFGFILAIFIYTLYNLYTSFRNEPKNTGAKIVHSFIISVCFFYFYWIFQQFQDVSKITYYFMTFASAFIVTLAVYLITQYRKDTIAQLKRKLFLVSKSALLHTPIDKKEKLYQEFKDIAKE